MRYVCAIVDDPKWYGDSTVVGTLRGWSVALKTSVIVCAGEGLCVVSDPENTEENLGSMYLPASLRHESEDDLACTVKDLAQAAYLTAAARLLVYIRSNAHHPLLTQTCDFLVAQAGAESISSRRPFIAVFNTGPNCNPLLDGFRSRIQHSLVDAEVFLPLERAGAALLALYPAST